MVRSRDELLDMLSRLEKNPATAHLMVRASKKRRAKSPQERLLTHVAKGVEALSEAASVEAGADVGAEAQEAAPGVADAPMRWMRINDVKAYIRLSSSTIYRMINDQGFPRPRKLGNSSVWDREEIDQFMEALPMMVIPRLDWAKKKQEK